MPLEISTAFPHRYTPSRARIHPGGERGVAVVELLLQAYPEAASIQGRVNDTPLDIAMNRVREKMAETTMLSGSDPLILLLLRGG